MQEMREFIAWYNKLNDRQAQSIDLIIFSGGLLLAIGIGGLFGGFMGVLAVSFYLFLSAGRNKKVGGDK